MYPLPTISPFCPEYQYHSIDCDPSAEHLSTNRMDRVADSLEKGLNDKQRALSGQSASAAFKHRLSKHRYGVLCGVLWLVTSWVCGHWLPGMHARRPEIWWRTIQPSHPRIVFPGSRSSTPCTSRKKMMTFNELRLISATLRSSEPAPRAKARQGSKEQSEPVLHQGARPTAA
jgi:hypothetical protein